jgi:hypothetical protein
VSDLSRFCKTAALAVLLAWPSAAFVGPASAQYTGSGDGSEALVHDQLLPENGHLEPALVEPGPPPEFGPAPPESFDAPPLPPPGYRPFMSQLGLRHSYTHSRSVGWGRPLVGTSWLNRPYYFGAEIGNMWMMRSVEDSVGRDVDAFGGFFVGADWDHYWGNELAFHWATPELVNSNAPDFPGTHSWFWWNYSLMYYPWGDAEIRPYWRLGIGNSRIDFPLDNGTRHGEWLLTLPIGVGIKWPIHRWLAARAELTDYLAFDGSDVPTQNNLTLTFGLEWRFGVHPRSYWPWHPSRHIW